MTLIDIVSRWTHIGTVIVLLGGSVFMRFLVMPAATELPEEEHLAFRTRLMGRWKRFVHAGIMLLLVSGFYNYFRAMPLHKGDKLYHPLIGIKIILGFLVFFLASALVGRSSAFQFMRENSKKWLGITILLAGTIVAISGYLKVAVKGTNSTSTPAVKQLAE